MVGIGTAGAQVTSASANPALIHACALLETRALRPESLLTTNAVACGQRTPGCS